MLQTIPEALVTVKRTYPAPRARVFRAWTDPTELKRWWGPSGYETVTAEIDLREGGRYRLGMRKLPDGEPFYLSGSYRQVEAPGKLVYSWTWEHSADVRDTVVTVEFRELGAGETEVEVTHALLPNAVEREKHGQGWNGCLEKLALAV